MAEVDDVQQPYPAQHQQQVDPGQPAQSWQPQQVPARQPGQQGQGQQYQQGQAQVEAQADAEGLEDGFALVGSAQVHPGKTHGEQQPQQCQQAEYQPDCAHAVAQAA